MPSIDKEELAWAAGIFEGEGTIGHYPKSRTFSARVKMIDQDIIERFARALAPLRVKSTGPHKPSGKENQQLYMVAIYNFETIQAMVTMFWPWLGTRRRAQARKALMSRAVH